MNILVVEDNATTAYHLKEYFLLQGYSATQVADSERALEMLLLNQFDAAVVDVLLPGPDGVSLLRVLRTDDRIKAGRTMPVVFVTGVDTGTVESLREGLTPYQPASVLQKPVEPDAILAEVERLAPRE